MMRLTNVEYQKMGWQTVLLSLPKKPTAPVLQAVNKIVQGGENLAVGG